MVLVGMAFPGGYSLAQALQGFPMAAPQSCLLGAALGALGIARRYIMS
jgi:NhaP-type Na+/H+ or K+/H+ antiporter